MLLRGRFEYDKQAFKFFFFECFTFPVDPEEIKNANGMDLLVNDKPPPDLIELPRESQDQEEAYDYPFPEDKDAEFRQKCKDKSKYSLNYC